MGDLNVGVAYCLAKVAAQASFYQNSKIYSIFKSISCSNPPYCPFICGESLQFWLFVANSLCNVQNELLVSKKPSYTVPKGMKNFFTRKDIVVFTNKRSQAKVSTVYLSYWQRIDNIDNGNVQYTASQLAHLRSVNSTLLLCSFFLWLACY